MTLQIVILAAGQGKRMQSQFPKVSHSLAGKPMLQHVVDTALELVPVASPCIVYGHEGKYVQEVMASESTSRSSKYGNILWVEQKEQLGTGHALLQALPSITASEQVLVLYGDVPLISVDTLKRLITNTPKAALGMITAQLHEPFGYGRIKRDAQDKVIGIVEEKDATAEERTITEVNTGIYYLPTTVLLRWLPTIEKNNAQNEYYLTDIIKLAVKEHMAIHTIHPKAKEEIFGVNDRIQLANLERFHQQQQAEKLMLAGVTLLDPNRIDIRGEVTIGKDVIIDVNVILQGKVVIGNHCKIGANTILSDTVLEDGVEIKSHCHIEGAVIGTGAIVGPFARLRPETKLAAGAHIGNFVEIKNSVIGEESKVNHLSYIGDSDIGKHVNVGAGTITCNYDGAHKHKTIIGDEVHIGSATQLIAPVKIGEGATIGAGSTVVKDVPANQLTVTARLEQRIIKDWKRPHKAEK